MLVLPRNLPRTIAEALPKLSQQLKNTENFNAVCKVLRQNGRLLTDGRRVWVHSIFKEVMKKAESNSFLKMNTSNFIAHLKDLIKDEFDPDLIEFKDPSES